MNCVLSGSAGLAFVADGARVVMLRVHDDAVHPAQVRDLHRALGDYGDQVFLEGVDLATARRHLTRAADASDALAQALITLDAGAPTDLRRDSARDLEPLLADPAVLSDLEAILSAAPLTDHHDAPGARAAAATSAATHAVALFTRLAAHQPAITAVRAAWDALPIELFETPTVRHTARALAARDGLFLGLVREHVAGRTGAAFLLETLRRRDVLRWLPHARRLVPAWIAAVFGEAAPPPRIDDERDEAEAPRGRDDRRRRATNPGALVSRSPGAKRLVDETLDGFRAELPRALRAGPTAAAALVDRTWQRLLEIHGTKADERTHVAKSAANIATLLIDQGHPTLAVRVLESSLQRGAADSFTYNALIDAYGKAGDVAGAQATFDRLATAGLADVVSYGTLIDVYGKADQLGRARALFDEAHAADLVNAFSYNSVLDAYGKAGDLVNARAMFELARAAAVANEVSYSTLIDAYGKAGELVHARAVFDEAVAAGRANSYAYNALIDAYGKAGDLARARAVFDEALAAAVASDVSYNTLMDAYGKAGELARAQAVFDDARRASLLDAFSYNTLIDAHGRAGDIAGARAIFDEAVARSLADHPSYGTLLNAYSKNGDLAGARAVFEQAVAAGRANQSSYNALVDAYGKAGQVASAQDVFDRAQRAGHVDEISYGALIDAYGRAGDTAGAQRWFASATAAGLVTDVTRLVLVRALSRDGSRAAAERGLDAARGIEAPHSHAGQKVLTTAAWLAARTERLDWLEQLPRRALTAQVLFSFATRTTAFAVGDAFLAQLGDRGAAALLALRWRAAAAMPSGPRRGALERIAAECRRHAQRDAALDGFSLIQLASTEARCLRELHKTTEAVRRLDTVDATRVSDRIVRASLLASAGQSHLLAGFEADEIDLAARGAAELAQAWNLARTEDAPFALFAPTTICALADALSGYASAEEVLQVPRGQAMASRLEPLLAEGARDGRQAIEAVRTWDLPQELSAPAAAGIRALVRLKQTYGSIPP